MIDEAFADIEKAAGPKSICRIFNMEQDADGQIIIGKMKITSRSLSRNLRGCTKVILFGATLGIGVDRIITRASLTDMSKAVVLQACAAACLEEFCDMEQARLAEELEQKGFTCARGSVRGTGTLTLRFRSRLCRCWTAQMSIDLQ